jgi:hypothetical protein
MDTLKHGPLADLQRARRLELERLRTSARAVVIAKPSPWPPAVKMVELRSAGEDIEAIARKTGYSVAAVKRALKQGGGDRCTGPQCEHWAGRQFTVVEALAEMPLPCGPDCVCSYRPIFNWE